MTHSHIDSCDDHFGHNHPSVEHNHDDEFVPAIQSSLYKYIDFDNITTFNESIAGSGKGIIKKTWDERLDTATVLESDCDAQILIFIPFTGQVKLHSIVLRTDLTPNAPKTLKLFSNRDDLDFSSVLDMAALQTLQLPLYPGQDCIELPLKRALYNNVYSLSIFIEDNYSNRGEGVTSLSYLGLKGDFTRLRKEPVIALYEAAANPADHTNMLSGAEYGSMRMGK